jgi:hypothetical protein
LSDVDETGIIPVQPVKPLVTPEQAAEEWARFESLKAKLLNEDDYQAIAGKRYIKRSGFRKIAVYFGLSDRILEQERTDRDDGSFMWRIVVEVEAPNGRISAGVGICDSRERRFAHVEHDVYATAHTRAKSRSISDMVAGGAVSAEEMEAEFTPPLTRRLEGVEEAIQPRSLGELEYWLREHITGFDEKLSVSEMGESFHITKDRYLRDDEFDMINNWVQKLGGRWISAGPTSHWLVPKSS